MLADTDRLVGFYMMIRRDVVEKIGLFDERFGTGCFEDDDYTRRAVEAGFRAVVARDAFVHHVGGRTFIGSGITGAAFDHVIHENQKRYQEKLRVEATEKYGRTLPYDNPDRGPPNDSGTYTIASLPREGLLLARSSIVLSACIIMRDNERTIGPCIESIRPWVDEINCVDIGSKDETPRIAERLGARLFHFPWCDSFSAARNGSFRHARGQWIFWLDSDDTIDAQNGHGVRELVRRHSDSSILAYTMKVHCPSAGSNGDMEITIVDQVKLIRNLPELR